MRDAQSGYAVNGRERGRTEALMVFNIPGGGRYRSTPGYIFESLRDSMHRNIGLCPT